MKISLHIVDATPEEVVAMLSAAPSAEVALETAPAVAAPSAPSAPSAPETQEPEPEAPEEPAGEAGPTGAAALVEQLSSQFKRAETITLAGGARGKDGVEVVTKDGEIGVIAACFRGRAVVEFDDGRGEEHGGSTLTLAATEDTTGAETTPEPEVEEVDPLGPEPAAEDELLTHDDVRAIAREVMTKFSGKVLMEIIGEVANAKMISEIDPKHYGEVVRRLRAKLASVG